MNQPTIKSPYFKNLSETDAFDDKVLELKKNPTTIVVSFDGDPEKKNCQFVVVTKNVPNDASLIASLLWTVAQILLKQGVELGIKMTRKGDVGQEINIPPQ